MSALQKQAKMTVDEFLVWAMQQPGDGKYELHDGVIVQKNAEDETPLTSMAPERFAHAEAKFAITAKLKDSIRRAGVECQAVVDALGVKVSDKIAYIPDALVNCGAPLTNDDLYASNPVIVVEVISSSSRARDLGDKFVDYFRVPSIQHYLVVELERRMMLHHRRGEGESIVTVIVKDGTLLLDPPGIDFLLDDVFPSAENG